MQSSEGVKVSAVLKNELNSQPSRVDFNLMKWSWDRCDPTRSVFVYGMRGSGKSFFVRDMMYNMRKKFHSGAAMSPTLDSRMEFSKFMPMCYIHDEFNIDAVKELINIKQSLQKTYHDGEEGDRRNVFLILDDCSYDTQKLNGIEMSELLMNGRHSKVFTITTLQWMKDLKPRMRENFDYIFLFQADSKETREKLFQMFGSSVFEDLEDFDKFYRVAVKDRRILVFDRTSKSERFEDRVFWYKAEPVPRKFHVGSRSYWEYAHYFSKDTTSSIEDAKRRIQETVRAATSSPVAGNNASSSSSSSAGDSSDRVNNVIRLLEKKGNGKKV